MATADVAMPSSALPLHDRQGVAFPSPIPRLKPRFDPAKHMAFEAPTGCLTMADLGLPADTGISPIAVTAPFQLFSPAGVRELRRDILSRECLENWSVSSSFSSFQTREHSKEVAPFVHQVWKHPAVLAAVSEAAGIELVPMCVCDGY